MIEAASIVAERHQLASSVLVLLLIVLLIGKEMVRVYTGRPGIGKLNQALTFVVTVLLLFFGYISLIQIIMMVGAA